MKQRVANLLRLALTAALLVPVLLVTAPAYATLGWVGGMAPGRRQHE